MEVMKLKKTYSRTAKNHDSTKTTTHHMSHLLTTVLSQIGDVYHDQSALILAAWPEIIGPQLTTMTQAAGFRDGVLTVKVRNSTLHSLLKQHEKVRLLQLMRRKFPKVEIRDIQFRIG